MRFFLRKNIITTMKTTYLKTGLLLIAAAMFVAPKVSGDTYSNTNFQSDIPGVAQHTDPNLVNPWGMAVSSGGTIGSATMALVFQLSTVRTAQPFRWW